MRRDLAPISSTEVVRSVSVNFEMNAKLLFTITIFVGEQPLRNNFLRKSARK